MSRRLKRLPGRASKAGGSIQRAFSGGRNHSDTAWGAGHKPKTFSCGGGKIRFRRNEIPLTFSCAELGARTGPIAKGKIPPTTMYFAKRFIPDSFGVTFERTQKLHRSQLQKNDSDKYTPFRAKSSLPACRICSLQGILDKLMPQVLQRDTPRKSLFKRQRIAVIVVPPVEELDLVGPMQVFSAANRLAGKPVYAVQVATNGNDLTVAGEAGLLSFLAHRRLSEVEGPFDSIL